MTLLPWLRCCLLPALVAPAGAGAAANGADGLFDLSLAQLGRINVSTASLQPAPVREQAGIVSVLTAEDMAAAGVRTLQEALLLVPGMSLGVDVFNVPGLVFRGTWAYEGKILFLVDDMPVNDLLFGTYAMPPDFPVAILERVEVLRGPGGARYGENAELAVIRIYTRDSAARGGLLAATLAAQRDGRPLRQASAAGQWQRGGLGLSFAGTVSAGSWGSGHWTDATGVVIDTSEQNQESAQLALKADWGGTRLQAYGEQFRLDAVQRYGVASPDEDMRFTHANLRLEHDYALGARTTLTPRWTWRNETTWHGVSVALPAYYKLPASRHTVELEAHHAFVSGALLRGGLQYYRAEVRAEQLNVPSAFPGGTPATYFDGRPDADLESGSAYAEAQLPVGNYLLSLGGRYSRHSESGEAAVPRMALTRAEADWHVKAVLDSAYREPQFETGNQRAAALSSELTTMYELEAGRRLGARQYVTASVFRYKLQDAIVFSVAPSGIPGYLNAPPFRGEGLELQWQAQVEGLQLQANYQRSRTDDDAIAVYDARDGRGQSLGAARDVANVWLAWELAPAWSLHPHLRYLGARTAYVHDPAGAGPVALRQARLPPEVTADLALRFRRWPWTVEAGLRNLTDEEQLLAQPYNGISPPYPVDAREGWLSLQFEF